MEEVFRYGKDGRTRIYSLKTLSETAAELWVEPWKGGEAARRGSGKVGKARRLTTLDNVEDAGPLLESIRQELRAGGWSQV